MGVKRERGVPNPGRHWPIESLGGPRERLWSQRNGIGWWNVSLIFVSLLFFYPLRGGSVHFFSPHALWPRLCI
jgi:hypothetical protein